MPELTYVDQGSLHSVADGQDLLLKFAESCGETAVMDKSPKL